MVLYNNRRAQFSLGEGWGGNIEKEKARVFSNRVSIRDVEAVIFQPLPLPLTKNEKTTVDIFFNFCGSVAYLLLHFIILRKQKPSFIAIT